MNITIVGRLGRDPELRFTSGGKAVASLAVAESHRKKSAAGVWEDAGTTWWDCTLWEQAAENAANTLTKGDRIILTGDTYTEEFTKRDGTQGKALKVRAVEVGRSLRFSEGKNGAASSNAASAPADDPWGGPVAPSGKSHFTDEPPF